MVDITCPKHGGNGPAIASLRALFFRYIDKMSGRKIDQAAEANHRILNHAAAARLLLKLYDASKMLKVATASRGDPSAV